MILSVVFLVIAIISSLGSTQTQTQNEDACNACCQGPIGIPGIPGPTGSPGRDGRDGMKGDRGESDGAKGDRGKRGLRGWTGAKGVIGQKGHKGELGGKKGQKGARGISIPGETGMMGYKGEKGEPAPPHRRSAFTAIKTSVQTGSTNDVVTFQTTSISLSNHFSLETNKFTCIFPGTYVFSFYIGLKDISIRLVKNGRHVIEAHTHTGAILNYSSDYEGSGNSNDLDAASNSVIINLYKGDQVWLVFGSSTSMSSVETEIVSFSGFLIYPSEF